MDEIVKCNKTFCFCKMMIECLEGVKSFADKAKPSMMFKEHKRVYIRSFCNLFAPFDDITHRLIVSHQLFQLFDVVSNE